MKRKIPMLCTGNSVRSQMAEAIVNTRPSNEWEAFSAGTEPVGYVHPHALCALAEVGVLHQGSSKHVDEFRDVPFDLVATVCDDAAENCTAWLGEERTVHVGIADPARAAGTEEEIMSVFRAARDEIARRLLALLRQ